MQSIFEVFIFLQLIGQISTANVSQIQILYDDIFFGYNKDLMPVLDQTKATVVSVNFYILSINNFDEISGKMEMSIWVRFIWTDERISWNATEFGGRNLLTLPKTLLWTPTIYLRESALHISPIGANSRKLRIYSNGMVSWNPAEVIHSTCTANVKKFPYDFQTCELMFSSWDYPASDLQLVADETVFESWFSENGEWILLPSKVKSRTIPGGISYMLLTINIKRRHEFYQLYLISPLLCMALLNKLVFFMPANSGERMSVAVTIFLSFIVYMNFISENVPSSSNPVAYIYNCVLYLMFYSLIIMFLCIVSLRIHDQQSAVPKWIQKIVYVMRLQFLRNRKGKTRIFDLQTSMKRLDGNSNNCKIIEVEESTMKQNGKSPESSADEEITWPIVGKTFDIFSYVIVLIFLVGVVADVLVVWFG